MTIPNGYFLLCSINTPLALNHRGDSLVWPPRFLHRLSFVTKGASKTLLFTHHFALGLLLLFLIAFRTTFWWLYPPFFDWFSIFDRFFAFSNSKLTCLTTFLCFLSQFLHIWRQNFDFYNLFLWFYHPFFMDWLLFFHESTTFLFTFCNVLCVKNKNNTHKKNWLTFASFCAVIYQLFLEPPRHPIFGVSKPPFLDPDWPNWTDPPFFALDPPKMAILAR